MAKGRTSRIFQYIASQSPPWSGDTCAVARPSPTFPGFLPTRGMMSAQPHVCVERVRWADVDLVGIARFSAFTRFVEHAEQEWLRAAGLPYSEIFTAPTIWMPRRHLSIEFFAPARLDEALALVTCVPRVGETSLTFNVDVIGLADETLKVSAAVVVVCVDVEQFAKRPLPRLIRDAVAPFQLDRQQAMARSEPARRELAAHASFQ